MKREGGNGKKNTDNLKCIFEVLDPFPSGKNLKCSDRSTVHYCDSTKIYIILVIVNRCVFIYLLKIVIAFTSVSFEPNVLHSDFLFLRTRITGENTVG